MKPERLVFMLVDPDVCTVTMNPYMLVILILNLDMLVIVTLNPVMVNSDKPCDVSQCDNESCAQFASAILTSRQISLL